MTEHGAAFSRDEPKKATVSLSLSLVLSRTQGHCLPLVFSRQEMSMEPQGVGTELFSAGLGLEASKTLERRTNPKPQVVSTK